MRPHTILVAEDDSATRTLLTALLAEPPGWQVTAVADGAQAVQALETLKVDLVVLDVNLPQCNGLEVYRHLRARADGAAVPVLFLTASALLPDHIQDLAGLYHWLAKPFDIEEILHHTPSKDGGHIPVRLMTDGLANRTPELSVVARAGGCFGPERSRCIRQNDDRNVYPHI
jgi:CheY-like chemotaxis protein